MARKAADEEAAAIDRPRRRRRPPTSSRVGLGGTVLGLAGPDLAGGLGGRGGRGRGGELLGLLGAGLASGLGKIVGIGDFAQRRQHAVPPPWPRRPRRAWRRRAWPARPQGPRPAAAAGGGQLFLQGHGPAQGLGGRRHRPWALRPPPARHLPRRPEAPRLPSWPRGAAAGGAPPARAAASFSLSVSGRPSVAGVGTLAAGAAAAASAATAPVPASSTRSAPVPPPARRTIRPRASPPPLCGPPRESLAHSDVLPSPGL